MGQEPTDEELFDMIAEVDSDGSGEIGRCDSYPRNHINVVRCEQEGRTYVPDLTSEIHWEEIVDEHRQCALAAKARPGKPSSKSDMDADSSKKRASSGSDKENKNDNEVNDNEKSNSASNNMNKNNF